MFQIIVNSFYILGTVQSSYVAVVYYALISFCMFIMLYCCSGNLDTSTTSHKYESSIYGANEGNIRTEGTRESAASKDLVPHQQYTSYLDCALCSVLMTGDTQAVGRLLIEFKGWNVSCAWMVCSNQGLHCRG